MSTPTFSGACMCGAVRYRAEGPALFHCHCHCRWCRKAHGAAFVTWTGVAQRGFQLEEPDQTRCYQGEPDA